MGGGEMIDKVTMTTATWNETPYKFQAGTPNFIQAIGLGAAVDYLDNIGMSEITNHEKQLTNYCLYKLHKVENLKIHGSAKSRIGVISFNIKDIHPHDLAQFLNEYNIAVRVGHHCAQPLLSKLNESSEKEFNLLAPIMENRSHTLMKAIDFPNAKYGRNSISIAQAGINNTWKMRKKHSSKIDTASFDLLPKISV